MFIPSKRKNGNIEKKGLKLRIINIKRISVIKKTLWLKAKGQGDYLPFSYIKPREGANCKLLINVSRLWRRR